MKKTLKPIALLGAVVLALGMSPAFAQAPPSGDAPGGGMHRGMHGKHGPEGPGDFMFMRLMHRLDLSADQRDKVKDIVRTYRDGDLGTAARDLRDAHHALEVAIWSTGSTEASISEAVQGLSAKIAAMAEVRHRMAGEITNVLTDEQRAQLQNLLQEPPPEPGMGPGMEPGGSGRPGRMRGGR